MDNVRVDAWQLSTDAQGAKELCYLGIAKFRGHFNGVMDFF